MYLPNKNGEDVLNLNESLIIKTPHFNLIWIVSLTDHFILINEFMPQRQTDFTFWLCYDYLRSSSLCRASWSASCRPCPLRFSAGTPPSHPSHSSSCSAEPSSGLSSHGTDLWIQEKIFMVLSIFCFILRNLKKRINGYNQTLKHNPLGSSI